MMLTTGSLLLSAGYGVNVYVCNLLCAALVVAFVFVCGGRVDNEEPVWADRIKSWLFQDRCTSMQPTSREPVENSDHLLSCAEDFEALDTRSENRNDQALLSHKDEVD